LTPSPRKKGSPRPERAAAARRAAAETTQAAKATKAGQGGPGAAAEFEPGGRPSDVFGELPVRGDGGEAAGLRRRDIFSMLVLHLIAQSEQGASYGNRLIERIETLTHGVVVLNPNTIYPLLRELESRGAIEGRWEHPEKRSRRLYSVTPAGEQEYERLRRGLEPMLDSIVESITLIKQEVYGGRRTEPNR
jgi:PadR family transcriptional regulator